MAWTVWRPVFVLSLSVACFSSLADGEYGNRAGCSASRRGGPRIPQVQFQPGLDFPGRQREPFSGFPLAVLSAAGSQKSSTAIAVAAPLFILALPLAETAISTLRRFLSGRSILQADSGHIHHRLMRLGFTPRRAVGLLYLGSAAFGLVSLFIIRSNATVVGLIALLLAAITWVGIQRLGYSEFAEINSALKRFVNQREIIRNSIVSRKLADDLRFVHSRDEAWPLIKSAAGQLGFSCVELRVRQHEGDGGVAVGDRAYLRKSYRSRPESARETSFAVALTGTGGELGEVVFSRAADAPPLHSELPLLISAVADGLPRILEEKPLPPTPAPSPQEQRPALTRLGDLSCPSCSVRGVNRSRSRSRLERIRKNLTAKRLHACEACGWRGWLRPLEHAPNDESMLIGCAPPDLHAIDLAIANARYASAADLSGMLHIDFQLPGRSRSAHP